MRNYIPAYEVTEKGTDNSAAQRTNSVETG